MSNEPQTGAGDTLFKRDVADRLLQGGCEVVGNLTAHRGLADAGAGGEGDDLARPQPAEELIEPLPRVRRAHDHWLRDLLPEVGATDDAVRPAHLRLPDGSRQLLDPARDEHLVRVLERELGNGDLAR